GRMGETRRYRAVRLAGRSELTAIAIERVALALIVRGDVDDERRRGAVVDEVVADPVGTPGLGVGGISPQTAPERGDAQHLAGGDVIGMAIVPVRDGDGARAVMADDVHCRSNRRRRRLDAAVGPLQVLAERGAEDPRRGGGLAASHLDRSVARELALRQIAEADSIARGGVARDGAAEAGLDPVGVRAEDEEGNRHSSPIYQRPCGAASK